MRRLVRVYKSTSLIKVFSDASVCVEVEETLDCTDEYFKTCTIDLEKIHSTINITNSALKYGLLNIPKGCAINAFIKADEVLQVHYKEIVVEGRIDSTQPRINRITPITKKLMKDGIEAGDEIDVTYYPKHKKLILFEK